MTASLSPLLSPDEREAVASFVNLLRQRYPEHVKDTVLFGSKARGDSHPGSDIDVLVVADSDDWRFQHAVSTLAARVSLDYDVLIGPRVIGQERWERMKREGFSLYRNIAREGIPLTPASEASWEEAHA